MQSPVPYRDMPLHQTVSAHPAPVLVLLGATASGKTALSIKLAERLNAEIVSADARQIYRRMTVGTAKPSTEDLARMPHHFINELDVTQPFDAGDFALQATERLKDIHKRGKAALVVGGSTLYLRALIEGLHDLPKRDFFIRARLEAELAAHGIEALFTRLQQLDAAYAGLVDRHNPHRVIRALEIIEASGKSVSELQQRPVPPPAFDFRLLGLELPRDLLYERINRRVEAMMSAGLLQEARSLYDEYIYPRRDLLRQKKPDALQHGDAAPAPVSASVQAPVEPSLQALNTVGYQELFAFFDGDTTLETAVTLIKQHTRNYAKRQLTYFRKQFDTTWIAAPMGDEPVDLTVEKIALYFPALHQARP